MGVKAGYKRTEVGVIPEDWEVNSVGDMGDVRAGTAIVASIGQWKQQEREKTAMSTVNQSERATQNHRRRVWRGKDTNIALRWWKPKEINR